ncbi:MAG TPA: M20/M25/M40 family metallo-hydrolase [Thermoprotei archaeon]|nr:MAG: hypothetical protein DRJ63_02950 [Thermoprotei archaeon]HDI75340.1 M20/M25/M40 family metallo-hydrolase [Thermoprotei archaeon]
MEIKIDEVASFLSELIKVNTSNPPGNETPAAKLVAEKLSEYGIEAQVLESEPNRGNVVAAIDSGEPGPTLLLLSHLDVVPADPKEWSVDPFSGLIKDGFVWGRGALDCKGAAVMELYAFIKIVQEKKFKGKIIYASTADEETGGEKGAKWLVESKPDLVKAEYVINEGGGYAIPVKGKPVFTVQTAEKGVYWFKLKFKGKPGHGSMPGTGDNAIVKTAQAAKRISEWKAPIVPTKHTEVFLKNLMKALGKPYLANFLLSPVLGGLFLRGIKEKSQRAFIEAMLRNTFAPTIVRGGYKENIIPSECELVVDCRLLPGFDETWVKETLKNIIGDIEYELSFIKREPATESPIDTPLFKAIEKTLAKEFPGALVSAYMVPGGTDSRFFRRKFKSVAYGYIPMIPSLPFEEIAKMVHGIDEKIPVEVLEKGVDLLYKTLVEFYSLV